MRKKLIFLLIVAMLCTPMAAMTSMASAGTIASYSATDVYPFYQENVNDYISSMWVGDVLWASSEYAYEVVENNGTIEISYDKDAPYFRAVILKFISPGIAKIKVTKKENSAEKIFEFTISPAQETYVENQIPKRIKIGYKQHSNPYVYRNRLFDGRGDGGDRSEIIATNFDSLLITFSYTFHSILFNVHNFS